MQPTNARPVSRDVGRGRHQARRRGWARGADCGTLRWWVAKSKPPYARLIYAPHGLCAARFDPWPTMAETRDALRHTLGERHTTSVTGEGMMGRLVATASIIMLAAIAAHAQPLVQQKLAEIDRTFVCPESLPSDQARQDAVKLFLHDLAAVQPDITLRQVTEFRVQMLRKHDCRATLSNIGAAPLAKSAPSAPTTNNTDHWERAGSISGPHGILITVDMDSMTSAGPGKMRTWIKYHYNGIGPKNVKESLIYEQLDCARNYHSTISLYSYGPDGQIVLSYSGKAEDEEPIIPESMLAGILPFTCAAHGLSAGR